MSLKQLATKATKVKKKKKESSYKVIEMDRTHDKNSNQT